MQNRRKRFNLFGSLMSFLLMVAIAATSMMSIVGSAATVDDLAETGAITQWAIAGDFNGWNSNANTVSGSSGSITIDLTTKVGNTIQFKAVAREGGDVWCTLTDSNKTISANQQKELAWGSATDGDQIYFNVNQPTVTFTISVINGKNYLTVTQSGGSTPTPVTPEIYTATAGSSIQGKSNLYPIKATFYDYHTDTEVSRGWRNMEESDARGGSRKWEPYSILNSKLRDYARDNNVLYPLYFGNFYDKNDGYAGFDNTSTNYRFYNRVNNSSRLTNMNTSVVGLTAKQLDSDGNICYYGSGDTQGAAMPLFDSEWLKANSVGTTVATDSFPMVITTGSNGVKYYKFNSLNGEDNVRFDNYGSNMTIEYGAGSGYGVYDALEWFSDPKESNGIGFFPFDRRSDHQNNAWDFGFGMRVDIPFNVGKDGKINGVEQVFDFSGDDDVWVFIDGELVLDLGGDHKKAEGKINFSTKTATVTTATQSMTSVSRNGSFSFNNQDPSVTHTLTMFYMERGMIESNLKFGFNFSPVGNQFTSTKTVDVADVNDGLADAVDDYEEFTFNHKTSSTQTGTYSNSANKEYLYDYSTNKTTTSDGNYSLNNGGSAVFTDQFEPGDYFKVTEGDTRLTYDTTWRATDIVTGDELGSGTGQTADFQFKTTATGDFAATRVQLEYVNTPQLGGFDLSKTVKSSDGQTLTAAETNNKEFDVTINVKLVDENFAAYPLTYTVGTSPTEYTLTSEGKLADGAKLKAGTVLHFRGIPEGATVRVVEDNDSEYTWTGVTGASSSYTIGNKVLYANVVASDDNPELNLTNTQKAPGETVGELTVTKTVNGEDYTGSLFTFYATPFATNPNSTIADTMEATVAVGGIVTFSSDGEDALYFTQPGKYRFVLYEKSTVNDVDSNDGALPSDIICDNSVYLAEIDVTKNVQTNSLVAGAARYYTTSKDASADFTDADFTDANKLDAEPNYDNTTQSGSVTIAKQDNTGKPVKDVTFAVYKVNSDGDSNFGTAVATGKTDASGYASVSNLGIYKDGFAASGNTPEYQWYAIKEVKDSATAEFNDNATVHYFRFHNKDNNGEWTYSMTYDYTNTFTILPDTFGSGMTMVKIIGLSIIGFAGALFCAYLIFIRKPYRKPLKHEKK